MTRNEKKNLKQILKRDNIPNKRESEQGEGQPKEILLLQKQNKEKQEGASMLARPFCDLKVTSCCFRVNDLDLTRFKDAERPEVAVAGPTVETRG